MASTIVKSTPIKCLSEEHSLGELFRRLKRKLDRTGQVAGLILLAKLSRSRVPDISETQIPVLSLRLRTIKF